MRVQRYSTKEIITLPDAAALGQGGEARVFRWPADRKLAAKVYHNPTAQQARKLTLMLRYPCLNPTTVNGHCSVAWPVDLLVKEGNPRCVVGFFMPCVDGMYPLFNFYNPKSRRQKCPFFDYRYLHRLALNITTLFDVVHSKGCVIGDVNESNGLVSDTALVSWVDSDSFQVRDPNTGETFRCEVGKPDFTPPELQGKNLSQVDRTEQHDRFGLGVLIWRLLCEGTHPFDGVFKGHGEPPSVQARISSGHFPHGKKSVPWAPKPLAPPFTVVHPALQRLFVRCFEEGHNSPVARPTAQEWLQAIKIAETSLIACRHNPHHWFGTP